MGPFWPLETSQKGPFETKQHTLRYEKPPNAASAVRPIAKDTTNYHFPVTLLRHQTPPTGEVTHAEEEHTSEHSTSYAERYADETVSDSKQSNFALDHPPDDWRQTGFAHRFTDELKAINDSAAANFDSTKKLTEYTGDERKQLAYATAEAFRSMDFESKEAKVEAALDLSHTLLDPHRPGHPARRGPTPAKGVRPRAVWPCRAARDSNPTGSPLHSPSSPENGLEMALLELPLPCAVQMYLSRTVEWVSRPLNSGSRRPP